MTTPIPAAGYPSDTSRTVADIQTYLETMLAITKEQIGGTGEAASVELSSNTFTPGNDACVCVIDTSGMGSSDTLNSIQVSTVVRDGMVVFIRSTDDSRVITVANGAGGAGQIYTGDGNDIILSSTKLFVALKYNASTLAFEEMFRTFGTGVTSVVAGAGINVSSATGAVTVSLATPVAVADGGTGATSLAGNGAIVMNSGGTAATSVAPGTSGNVLTSDGTSWLSASPSSSGSGPCAFGGRVYLVAGSPVADGSSSRNSTIYCGPYTSNQVNFAGTNQSFSEVSLAVTATAGTAYTLYLTSASSSTVTLAQDSGWSSPTTPPTFYFYQGQTYLDSEHSQLVVGAYYCPATNEVADWTGERLLSNITNAVQKSLVAQDPTMSWTYTGSTYRNANGDTTNGTGQVQVFTCLQREPVSLTNYSICGNYTGAYQASIAIGLDGTYLSATGFESYTADAYGTSTCNYCASQIGLHTYSRMESCPAGSTAFFAGSVYGAMYGTCFN